MTPQKMISVDFSEIPSLQVTCRECGGKIVFPIPSPKLEIQQHLGRSLAYR